MTSTLPISKSVKKAVGVTLTPERVCLQEARQKVDHPRWLEARVEGEVVKSESIVVEMGCGVRMLVANVGQAALAAEVLRAMGLGRAC